MKGNDKSIRLVSFCPCGKQMTEVSTTRAGFGFYKCPSCGHMRMVKGNQIVQEWGRNDYTKI